VRPKEIAVTMHHVRRKNGLAYSPEGSKVEKLSLLEKA
jgi:hypothetical protein